MAISRLLQTQNIPYYEKYPKSFILNNTIPEGLPNAPTFKTSTEILGEGYLDLLMLACTTGGTSGGSNRVGFRVTIDSVQVIDIAYSTSGGWYTAGFYQKDIVRNMSHPQATRRTLKIGDNYAIDDYQSNSHSAIVTALSGTSRTHGAEALFPIKTDITKMIHQPVFFKNKVLIEGYRDGYFYDWKAIVSGGIR